MKLIELLRWLPGRSDSSGIPDLDITGIEEDSRKVHPGYLFVARSGTKTDGTQFLADAHRNGAVAAIVAARVPDCPLTQVVVTDPSAALSPLACGFYGNPSHDLKVMAITGTNGKTTSAYLIQQILAYHGIHCGMIGTVQIDNGKTRINSEMTTPSPVDVARIMAEMRDNGCKGCAIEVSSHSLHQGRVGAIRFAAGAFTNLTGDHLDYHETMDNYAEAKARLFAMLPPESAAIINSRDAYGDRMIHSTAAAIRRFGIEQRSDYRAADVRISAQGTRFTMYTPRGSAMVQMKLVGMHNVENALTAAASVAEAFGLSAHQIAQALALAPGAPGRLQVVDTGQKFAVLVDYAHTDDALRNVLTALRPLTRGKLRVLFGCGGDRDRTKRPRMAKIAQELADALYITSDNPRTEDPQQIINEILTGLAHPSTVPLHVQPDRRQAIAKAIGDASDGDVVLLAGKGHEDYQIIGKTKHHFDDVEEALKVLKCSH